MGNVIINQKDNSLNLDTTTQLGKFIQNWALNNYNIHQETNSKYPKKFNNSLKKIACCTYSPIVGINISGVNSLQKENANKILSYQVNIAPFNGDDGNPSFESKVINSNNCLLSNDDDTDQNFLDNDITPFLI